jgi:hypothetical protein
MLRKATTGLRGITCRTTEMSCCSLSCLVVPDLPLQASVCFKDRSRTLEMADDEREANENARPLGKYSAVDNTVLDKF